MRPLLRSFAPVTAALAFAACGDNDHTHEDDVDAAPQIDAAPDVDAPPATDAGPDAPPAYVPPTPIAVPLSAAGPDQLMTAVAVPGGTGFYAAGFAAATVAGDRIVTVVKLTAAGALDTTWGGGDGIAPTTLVFAGGADEIDLALQSDGKIIVSAVVANGGAGDRDVAVTRLDTDGTVDNVFGGSNNGVRVLDLTTGSVFSGGTANYDRVRGVAVDTSNRIYLHCVVRRDDNGTPQADTDFAVVRLTDVGALDTTYGGGDGRFTLDIQQSFATTRSLAVFSDGKVIAGGYANSTGVGSVQPVVYRVNADGTALDTGFATQGLFHAAVLQVQTEVYNFAVQNGTHLVTAGYGRNSGDQNDWVSLRFAIADGARDTAWGGTTNGAVLFDVSGANVGDNCRNAVALPGGRTLMIGSSSTAAPGNQDAAFAVLSPTGQLDTAFGDGTHTYQLGANGLDQFWGAAVNGNNAIVVGWSGSTVGSGQPQTDTNNDNSYGLVVTMP